MSFRKFRAGQIFDGYHLHNDQTVLVADTNGVIQDLIPASEAGDDVQYFNGIISPGFINCHCHLELSYLQGMIPEDTGLVDFVLAVVNKRMHPTLSPERISESIENAENEMLAAGIVAVGDICNDALTLHQKSKGRLLYRNFIEASGVNPAIVPERFEKASSIYHAFNNVPATTRLNSIVPHAPYSVANELWELIVNFPGNHLLTIHNQETAAENDWFMNKQGDMKTLYDKMNIDTSSFTPSGKSSLQSYLPKFLANQQVILVHNVFTSQEDIAYCQLPVINSPLYWCLCPNANLYISRRLPPVDLLIKNDCDIVLGTDSLASNHTLSIAGEIKTLLAHFPQLPLATALQWATINGARALQLNHSFGSFEKGKNPGVILLENDLSAVRVLV